MRAPACSTSVAIAVILCVHAPAHAQDVPVADAAGLAAFTIATPVETPIDADLAVATGAPGAPSALGVPIAPPYHAQRRDISAPRDAESKGGVLDAERAKILLRSLTIPGWGQATAGHTTAATVFGLAELGIWTSFAAFRIQEQMRLESSETTAQLFAGIDLEDRDTEFRRIVGSYASSEEYNRLVVYRDAANLYLSDLDNPDYDGYRAYIAEHSLSGANAWNWASFEAFTRYSDQRQDAQRAQRRAHTALAAAVANRLLSVVHAARMSKGEPEPPRSWNLELGPVLGGDATAFRAAVHTRF